MFGENGISGWFLAMIIMPVIVAMMRESIAKQWNAYKIYKNRAFDKDGDPDSPEVCLIVNPATGGTVPCVILSYEFWTTDPLKKGVHTIIVDTETGTGKERHFSFSDWAGAVKLELERDLNDAENELLKSKELI